LQQACASETFPTSAEKNQSRICEPNQSPR
jgi:hypothetical protein